jgi:hypothetical protein
MDETSAQADRVIETVFRRLSLTADIPRSLSEEGINLVIKMVRFFVLLDHDPVSREFKYAMFKHLKSVLN